MADFDFIPETLKWCDEHYVPPVRRFITCEDFGHSDGMNGSCHWCMEMEPYQWHMCQDEDWVRGLLSPAARIRYGTREAAAEFIEQYKQRRAASKR